MKTCDQGLKVRPEKGKVIIFYSLLPDGNGAFSSGMGMLVDKSDLGFGPRSWRYSMLVRDGVIEKMFAEDFATPGDPFEVSDAMTMLEAMGDPAAQSA
mgnify:CR=1 FL=1